MSIRLLLPTPHKNQIPIVQDSRRYVVENCGRRFGKSELDILECDPILHGYPVGLFFPTYKMLEEVWRRITSVFMPANISLNKTEHRMELATHGVLEAWSLEDPDKARGHKYKRVIIDEAAAARNLEYAWYNVISPSLLDLSGDARIKSTPKGMNFFWKMAQFANSDKDWSLHHYSTYDNPYIKAEEIDKLKFQLPAMAYQQEILAEFIQGEGAVFRNIDACMNALPCPWFTEPMDEAGRPVQSHRIVAGIDWGKQNDFTVISVGCATCKRELFLDRFNQIDYHFQRDRLTNVFRQWKIATGMVETNSIGTPNLEELQRSGLPVSGFETTATSKPPLIENLALALEQAEWQFLNDPTAKSELVAYERKVNDNTGRSSYGAPEGLHDDTVMARALMLRAAGSGWLVL